MEAEAMDVGAVLLGDVALLVMAPLVIYAALKMIWEEQFEETDEEAEKDAKGDVTERLVKKQTVMTTGMSDLESTLADPVLKDVATRAARNIIHAVNEALDRCSFDSSLDELAVKHGGRERSSKWIESLFKDPSLDGINPSAQFIQEAEKMTRDELCLWISKLKAEKSAMAEIRKLIKLLIDRHLS